MTYLSMTIGTSIATRIKTIWPMYFHAHDAYIFSYFLAYNSKILRPKLEIFLALPQKIYQLDVFWTYPAGLTSIKETCSSYNFIESLKIVLKASSEYFCSIYLFWSFLVIKKLIWNSNKFIKFWIKNDKHFVIKNEISKKILDVFRKDIYSIMAF